MHTLLVGISTIFASPEHGDWKSLQSLVREETKDEDSKTLIAAKQQELVEDLPLFDKCYPQQGAFDKWIGAMKSALKEGITTFDLEGFMPARFNKGVCSNITSCDFKLDKFQTQTYNSFMEDVSEFVDSDEGQEKMEETSIKAIQHEGSKIEDVKLTRDFKIHVKIAPKRQETRNLERVSKTLALLT